MLVRKKVVKEVLVYTPMCSTFGIITGHPRFAHRKKNPEKWLGQQQNTEKIIKKS